MTDVKKPPRRKPKPPLPDRPGGPGSNVSSSKKDSGDEEDDDYLHPIEPSPKQITIPTPGPRKRAGSNDLAAFVREYGLPACVRVTQPFHSGSSAMSIREGDEIMLHCDHHAKYVKATDSNGRRYQLPVYAKQLYQILPQDPRLDDKIYLGTASLILADPLPEVVRVIEGHYSDKEEDTKEIGDIIHIKNINNEKILIGESLDYSVRYRFMNDSAEYSTMIRNENLPMSALIEEVLPMRVRTSTPDDHPRDPGTQLILRLEEVVTRDRIIATRRGEDRIFTIPAKARMMVEEMAPPHHVIAELLKPLYDLINKSCVVMDACSAPLPAEMQAIPQPMDRILDEWQKSHEGKNWAADVANQDVEEFNSTLSKQRQEINKMTAELRALRGKEPPPPPRPLGSHPSHPVPPPVPAPKVPARPGETPDSDDPSYDIVSTDPEPISGTGTLARTDLEKILKNLLAEKELKMQDQARELNELRLVCKNLENELLKKKQECFKLETKLEIEKDTHDAYDIMIPGVKKSLGTRSPEQPVLTRPVPLPTTPSSKPPSSPLPSIPKSHPQVLTRSRTKSEDRVIYDPPRNLPGLKIEGFSPKAPNSPLPTVPTSPTKNSKGEYAPPQVFPTVDPSSLVKGVIHRAKTLTEQPLPPPPLPSDPRHHPAYPPQTDSLKWKKKVSPPSSFQDPSNPISPYDLPYQVAPIAQPGDDSPPGTPPYEFPDPAPLGQPPIPQRPLSPTSQFNPVLYSTPDTNLAAYTMEDVARLLKSLGLENSVETFRRECIDGALLLSIDEDMMINELSMTKYQARKLTMKIDELMN